MALSLKPQQSPHPPGALVMFLRAGSDGQRVRNRNARAPSILHSF